MNAKKWLRGSLGIVALAGLLGCESMGDHKGAIIGGVGGAVIGAAAGAAIGGNNHRGSGAAIGAAIGAAGGAVAGDQMYDKNKREKAENDAKEAAQ